MAPASQSLSREYTNLIVREFQSNDVWVSLAGAEESAELQARDYFWWKAKDRVLAELDKLEGEGWKPLEFVGPQAIKLRKEQTIDFSLDPADILLWFMTLGIALIMQLVMNTPRRYVSFKPIEVRIQLSRPTNQRLLRVA